VLRTNGVGLDIAHTTQVAAELVAVQQVSLVDAAIGNAATAKPLLEEPPNKRVDNGHISKYNHDKGFTDRPVARLCRVAVAKLH
jgi:hypothetical protein